MADVWQMDRGYSSSLESENSCKNMSLIDLRCESGVKTVFMCTAMVASDTWLERKYWIGIV